MNMAQNGHHPEYCQVLKVKDTNGQIKELVFPKALDLNRPKRPRTTFSPDQLRALETRFTTSPYLIGKERTQLAQELGLSETQIKVWFQNRRTKTKRDVQSTSPGSTVSTPEAKIWRPIDTIESVSPITKSPKDDEDTDGDSYSEGDISDDVIVPEGPGASLYTSPPMLMSFSPFGYGQAYGPYAAFATTYGGHGF